MRHLKGMLGDWLLLRALKLIGVHDEIERELARAICDYYDKAAKNFCHSETD